MSQLQQTTPTDALNLLRWGVVLLHILVFAALAMLFPMTFFAVAITFSLEGGGVGKCVSGISNFLFCTWAFYAFVLPLLQVAALVAMRIRWMAGRYQASVHIGFSPFIGVIGIGVVSILVFLIM